MHLVLAGCEYSGTTTLNYTITNWGKAVLAEGVGFHDHWKVPHLSHPTARDGKNMDEMIADYLAGKGEDPTTSGFTEEEQNLFLALTPSQKEMFQRYHMEYHLSDAFYSYDHHNVVGMHIDEAVYAGLYYGYGGDGEYSDRRKYARYVEKTMLRKAPDTVMVLVKATPEVIRRRMKERPHHNGVVKDKDVELVLQRFEEEYEQSVIEKKFTIDTSTATVEESLAEFLEKIDEFLTDADRTSILVRKAKQRGEWI